MAVFGYVKFQVCLKSVNISFEPDFGNPRFETPKKTECFQFSVNLFLSNFIIWFCTSLSRETWSFELISQSFLFYAQQQKIVFKPSFSNLPFQNSGSNPTWFWKPEKKSFQTWKGPFLVYFKRAIVKLTTNHWILGSLKRGQTPCQFCSIILRLCFGFAYYWSCSTDYLCYFLVLLLLEAQSNNRVF